jgi:hypothetical protein
VEERRKKGTEEEEEEEQRWEWERQGRGLYKKRGGGSNRWGVTADQTAGGTACVRACVVVWFETRRPGRAGRRANAVGGGLGTAGEGGHASPVAGWRAPRRPARWSSRVPLRARTLRSNGPGMKNLGGGWSVG